MNNRTLPMLGSNGQGEIAAEKWHEALLRLSKRHDRDSTIPPFKQTLGTRYCAEFEESSAPAVIEYADEMDELPEIAKEHRRDSWVGVGLAWMFAVCAVLGLLAWKFGWIAQ